MSRMRSNAWFIEQVRKQVGKEYTFLEPYSGTDTKIEVVHNSCGLHYKVTPYHFLRDKNRCPHCSMKYTNEQYQLGIRKKWGDQWIPLVKISNANEIVPFYHADCGKISYKSYKSLQNGKGCKYCANVLHGLKRRKSNLIFIKQIKARYGNRYTVLTRYETEDTKVKVQCNSCNNTWWVTPHNLLRGFGCPHCSSSHGEMYISKILKTHSIKYIYQKRFNDLKNPKTSYPLYFDFYLPEYKLCIECDGLQHSKAIKFFGGKDGLKIRKYRDNLKDKYCQEHHIRLIRLKYNSKNFVELSSNILNELNMKGGKQINAKG